MSEESRNSTSEVDLNSSQFNGGMMIAGFVGFLGYTMALAAFILIIVGLYKSDLNYIFNGCVGVAVSLSGMVLVSHIAKAVMKTADYTRICALNSTNKQK